RTKKNAELVVLRKERKALRITGRATADDLSRARDAIDRGLTAFQAKGERIPFDGARLSRGESDAKAWLDRLRTLVKGAETFREAPPSVARDSTADPKLRVAIDAAISDDEGALHEALVEIGRNEQL